jgi:UDP-N-acetylglucosamine diphosphorylase/glucosamine-1-phosphate N-acetyltransferase
LTNLKLVTAIKKSNNIVLFDGQCHSSLLPLSFTRPVADIRVGIFTIREKWNNYFGININVRCKTHLSGLYSSVEDEASLGINAGLLPNDTIVQAIEELQDKEILMQNGNVLAISPLPANNSDIDAKLAEYKTIEYSEQAIIIKRSHDIFLNNELEINNDFDYLKQNTKSIELDKSNTLIGNNIIIEQGAKIRCSIINTEDGPVYIGKNAEIMEGSIIKGPTAILNNAVVKIGAKIYGATTIGPWSKVGGEVGNSVIFGYSNKAHDGYLGNSVLGHWCNLGADTNTSNLKNNYSNVKTYDYPSKQMIDTGTQYCGLTMGDHSKCGINTMFNTGTVVGVFANIFDSGFPQKFIPSFSWGGKDGFEEYNLEKAIEVAKKVMLRRDITLDDDEENVIRELYKITAESRK